MPKTDRSEALEVMARDGYAPAQWAIEEIAFWQERAIWWCAYAENGLRGKPDEVDLHRARKVVEDERE